MHLKLFAKSCIVSVYFVPNLLVSIVQKLCILYSCGYIHIWVEGSRAKFFVLLRVQFRSSEIKVRSREFGMWNPFKNLLRRISWKSWSLEMIEPEAILLCFPLDSRMESGS